MAALRFAGPKNASLWAMPGLLALLVGCGTDQTVKGTGSDVQIVNDLGGSELGGATDATDAITASDSTGQPEDGGSEVDSGPDLDVGPSGCPADHCLIDGQCLANGTIDAKNPCQRCRPIDSTTAWSPDDSATCDDGKACSLEDHCSGGACVGTAKACGDGNVCTVDSCDDTGACVYLPATATCEDGDVCTQGDLCKNGSCAGGFVKLVCDDGNPCTSNACDSAQGCVFAASSASCDDGDACTSGDTCKGGACLPGAVTSCDDADLCTIDACDPKKGCKHTSVANLCADSNPCTDETCDPKQGCVYPFNKIPCDDLNACTAADTCSQGACLGLTVNPDDGNVCTDDACDPKVGPVHVANSAPCDDANACTLEDTCSGAKCQPGLKNLPCDDANVCTDDSCDPKSGCVFTPNSAPCDDGTACTANDTCAATLCQGVTVECDDQNACTTDSCDAKKGCVHSLIVSNACRPVITVTYPPRAATIQQSGPNVVVTGKVTSGAGPITSFTLNGNAVQVGVDGAFSSVVTGTHGGNTLLFQATDSFGSSKKRVQSFLLSTAYFKPDATKPLTGMVDPGLGYWLSQQIIDSGVHDKKKPKDLATIFEIVLGGINIGTLLNNPIYNASNLTVNVSGIGYDAPKVTLKAQPGSLHMTGTLPNLTAKLDANYKLCVIFCTNIGMGGTLTASSVVIGADVVPTVAADHTLAVKLANTTVAINDLKVTLDNSIANFLLGGVVNVALGLFKSAIQNAFAAQIQPALEPTLSSALGALAIKTSFDVPKLDGSGGKVTVDLYTDFAGVAIDTPGAEFDLRARATAKKVIAYDNLGVPARQGCGAGVQKLVVLKQSPLELSVADDSFNELLYATWQGGLFEFPVPASLLGNVDLVGYGISDLQLKVSAMLAPTMADCNAKGQLIAHVGDLRVDASLKLFGQQMDVVMYATFTAGVQVVAKDGKLGISLDKVQTAELEVDVQQDNLVSSENVLEKLVKDNLLTGLVAQLGGNALGSFPIPAIDLSAAAKLPPGTAVIAINPTGVTRKDGNSVVGGTLQ